MLLRISLLLFTLFISPVFSGPTGLPTLTEIKRYTGVGKTSGRYLVTLKDGAPRKNLITRLVDVGKTLPVPTKIVYEWETVCNGFAALLDPVSLALLQTLPEVESIEEDGIMKTTATTTQTNAPWGLARLSSRTKLANQDASKLNFNYAYDDSAGTGVDIYIIDTGVQVEHVDFGGRARWAATFGGYQQKDGNGHGTHVAATAAGTTYGVAKKANIYAIKVLSDEGSGNVADIVAALNYVGEAAAASGRPTIVNMSLGGSPTQALDDAVARLVRDFGVHVVVAAGNDNADAGNISPARVPSAITVGASNIQDAKASFSNFGGVIDVFAPGQDLTNCYRFLAFRV
ncbi:hypothetical protein MD484_g1587, partial [Candolleomyces efflorescens]